MGEGNYKPVMGADMYGALAGQDCIVMAANMRITKGVARGILHAAKDTDSALILELARSECNLDGGYTGFTPALYSEHCRKAAAEVGFDIWALHGDHITIKKGTQEEIGEVKKLVAAQIEAGYTSFAIDASYLFNFEGETPQEELAQNIEVTTEMAKFIEDSFGGEGFGLEVEVGEIGKKSEEGMVLTTPEEASTYITALNENGVKPHVIAIANGSTHGNIFDEQGRPIEQVSIDIELTKRVAAALREQGAGVRIAQHGITGTPIELIYQRFPHGDIIKGNVATHFQNLVWNTFKLYRPELYEKAYRWVIDTYHKEGKTEVETFGKSGKYAAKQFFDEIYAMDAATEAALEAATYADALKFFFAFKAHGSAQKVRDYIASKG
jgi:fructose-bisphosphate aldolase class II